MSHNPNEIKSEVEKLILEAQKIDIPAPEPCEVYLAPMGEAAVRTCFALATELRAGGISATFDTVGRGLKAQMKYADKIEAKYLLVIGENEIKQGLVKIKNMKTGEEKEVKLNEQEIKNIIK